MTDAFEAVQKAAQTRYASNMSSEAMARQIVNAAQGDMRVAYDFLDALTNHVSRMLREGKG